MCCSSWQRFAHKARSGNCRHRIITEIETSTTVRNRHLAWPVVLCGLLSYQGTQCVMRLVGGCSEQGALPKPKLKPLEQRRRRDPRMCSNCLQTVKLLYFGKVWSWCEQSAQVHHTHAHRHTRANGQTHTRTVRTRKPTHRLPRHQYARAGCTPRRGKVRHKPVLLCADGGLECLRHEAISRCPRWPTGPSLQKFIHV